MKVNKKIVVPFLSAVIGLSVSGGIGGAFAWYQYNSQVTASFVGTSVADTSVLQIGHKVGETITWERDYIQPGAKLVPVTFGALGEGGVLGSQAYGYPEAGKQSSDNYDQWTRVAKAAGDVPGYVQFDVYLRALKADKSPVALPVYLSDIVIADFDDNSENGTQSAAEAIRIHLNVEGNPNRLISKTGIDNDHKLPLFGSLDLDGDGQPDTKGGYSWTENRTDVITYGKDGDYQTTTQYNAMYPEANEDGTFKVNDANNAVKICTTKNTTLGTEADYVKITVTVWLEGWAKLQNGETTTSTVWDPTYTEKGLKVRVGMTFDTGKVRLS